MRGQKFFLILWAAETLTDSENWRGRARKFFFSFDLLLTNRNSCDSMFADVAKMTMLTDAPGTCASANTTLISSNLSGGYFCPEP